MEGKFYEEGFFFYNIKEVKTIVSNLKSWMPAEGEVNEIAMFRFASNDIRNAEQLLKINGQHADEYKDIYPDTLAATLKSVEKYVTRALDKVNNVNVVFNSFANFAGVSNKCIAPINSLTEEFLDNLQSVIGVTDSNDSVCNS